MTLANSASRITAENGSACTSRSSLEPRWTGPWFNPPSLAA